MYFYYSGHRKDFVFCCPIATLLLLLYKLWSLIRSPEEGFFAPLVGRSVCRSSRLLGGKRRRTKMEEECKEGNQRTDFHLRALRVKPAWNRKRTERAYCIRPRKTLEGARGDMYIRALSLSKKRRQERRVFGRHSDCVRRSQALPKLSLSGFSSFLPAGAPSKRTERRKERKKALVFFFFSLTFSLFSVFLLR